MAFSLLGGSGKNINFALGKIIIFSFFSALSSFASAVPEPWNEAESGRLYFSSGGTDDNRSWVSGTHLHTHSEVDINGLLVRVSLNQKFVNDSASWQEAVYALPLPENAAIHAMRITVGQRQIIAEIQEKEQAEKTYRQAREAGKKAALLVQRRPNLFTQKIANIPPGEHIEVDIEYLDNARYTDGQFSWRMPTTLTPRYIPGYTTGLDSGQVAEDALFSVDEMGWARPTNRVPDASTVTPYMSSNVQNPLSLDLTLRPGMNLQSVTSPYHSIQAQQSENVWRVTLAEGSVAMDRDFVLQWLPEPSDVPVAAAFRERLSDGHDYLMVTMIPPRTESITPRARDILFILDTSGSMEGSSIRQAKLALDEALSRLQASDRFNILQFNSEFSALYPTAELADHERVKRARHWVESLRAGGGTEMYGVLQHALASASEDEEAERVQQIVFITDGAVGNENELFELVHQNLGARRLFTVGIGSAPNSYFMRKAAQFGRGSFTYIGDISEVSGKMRALFDKLGATVASHFQLHWPTEAEVYPPRIPDLYAGEPLTILARLDVLQGQLRWEGKLGTGGATQPWRGALDLHAISVAPQDAGIAKSWARQKVESLMDRHRDDSDEGGVRQEVVTLGLQYGLVTPYTSFVAVEPEISRPSDELLQKGSVPNRTPHGQSWSRGVAYPATATPMQLYVLLGTLALVLLMLNAVWPRWLRGAK